MRIKIKLLHPDAKLPSYAHATDIGLDLFARETYTLVPGERRIFFVGFALEIPEGYAAIVKDKSGLPKLHGLHIMGGVYDPGYRGEYNVNLINLGTEPYTVEIGQKIAQLLIIPVARVTLDEASDLSHSSRAEGRFGSTGKF